VLVRKIYRAEIALLPGEIRYFLHIGTEAGLLSAAKKPGIGCGAAAGPFIQSRR
jgi:hypothetical protein